MIIYSDNQLTVHLTSYEEELLTVDVKLNGIEAELYMTVKHPEPELGSIVLGAALDHVMGPSASEGPITWSYNFENNDFAISGELTIVDPNIPVWHVGLRAALEKLKTVAGAWSVVVL